MPPHVNDVPADVADLSMLIYTSLASHEMSKNDLMDILTKSRENNATRNITGLLLYKSGNFLQVLEGSDSAITELYEIIRHDRRHHQITLVYKRLIPKRDFGKWEMGFTNLSSEDATEIAGFSTYLLQTISIPELIHKNSVAHVFLEAFRHVMR